MSRLALPNLQISKGVTPFVGLPIEDIKQAHAEFRLASEQVHEGAGAIENFINNTPLQNIQGVQDMVAAELTDIQSFTNSITKNKNAHFKTREIKNKAKLIQNHKGIQSAQAAAAEHAKIVEENEANSYFTEEEKYLAASIGLRSIKDFKYDKDTNKVTNGTYSGLKLPDISKMDENIRSVLSLFKSNQWVQQSDWNPKDPQFEQELKSVKEFLLKSGKTEQEVITQITDMANARNIETGNTSPYLEKTIEKIEEINPYDVKQAVYSMFISDPLMRSYIEVKRNLEQERLHIMYDNGNNNLDLILMDVKSSYTNFVKHSMSSIDIANELGMSIDEYTKLSKENKEIKLNMAAEKKWNVLNTELNSLDDSKRFTFLQQLSMNIKENEIISNYGDLFANVIGFRKVELDNKLVSNVEFDKRVNESREISNATVISTQGEGVESTENYGTAIKKLNAEIAKTQEIVNNYSKGFDRTDEGIRLAEAYKRSTSPEERDKINKLIEMGKEAHARKLREEQGRLDELTRKKSEIETNKRLNIDKAEFSIKDLGFVSEAIMNKAFHIANIPEDKRDEEYKELLQELIAKGIDKKDYDLVEDSKIILEELYKRNLITKSDYEVELYNIENSFNFTRYIPRKNKTFAERLIHIIRDKISESAQVEYAPSNSPFQFHLVKGSTLMNNYNTQLENSIKAGTISDAKIVTGKYKGRTLGNSTVKAKIDNSSSMIIHLADNPYFDSDNLMIHISTLDNTGKSTFSGVVTINESNVIDKAYINEIRKIYDNKLRVNAPDIESWKQLYDFTRRVFVQKQPTYDDKGNQTGETIGKSLSSINPNDRNVSKEIMVEGNKGIRIIGGKEKGYQFEQVIISGGKKYYEPVKYKEFNYISNTPMQAAAILYDMMALPY